MNPYSANRPLPYLLLAPLLVFLMAFFLFPLLEVFALSFTDPETGLDNYRNFFSDPFYWRVLGTTFSTAGIVTLFCLLAGYPLAYFMANAGRRAGGIALLVVALSYWTSFLVRTYAWMILLGNNGPVLDALRALGWSSPPELLFTRLSSTLAMVHVLVPLMAITLYSVMKKIDPVYVRAARSLGARPWTAFCRVFFPQTLPGVINGCTMIFIICLGFYVIPVLLGSPREQMIAGVIGQQMDEMGNFGEASTMAVVLTLVTLLLYGVYSWWFDARESRGAKQ